MVAIRRSPGQPTVNQRTHDLVNVGCAVFQICVLACDEITVEHYQLLMLVIQDRVHHRDRVDVLLGSPAVPSICDVISSRHSA